MDSPRHSGGAVHSGSLRKAARASAVRPLRMHRYAITFVSATITDVPGSWPRAENDPSAAQLGAAEKAKLALPFAHFLARLHAEIPADEANALGVPDYVVPDIEALSDPLAKRLGSPARLRLLDSMTAAVPSMAAPGPPLVLLHNDFSHHNIGFDPESSEAVGVFDFGSAFVGDLHRDLRYDPGIPIADATVVRTYEALSGVQVSRPRQRAWHALSALENLAYSLDHEGPELQAARWGWVDAVAAWDLGFFDAL